MTDIKSSILDTIGRTPLVRIHRILHKPGVELLAKLEGHNPLGSIKERIALSLVEGAEREGLLKPGMTLIESSSGNTGIGLAMVGAVKGYKVVITMAKKVSVERRKLLRALGAEVILVDGGSDDAWDMADELHAKNPGKYFRIHQYKSPHNPRAHYEGTGPELWEQTGGRIDAVVVTLGTCGTLMGLSRFLREKDPKIRIVAVEPTEKHEQQGIRNLTANRVPEIFDPAFADERLICRDEDAYHWARELALKEGIFAGISSGSAIWGALEVVKRMKWGVVVAILPDRGEKYLSTPLWGFPDDPVVNAPVG